MITVEDYRHALINDNLGIITFSSMSLFVELDPKHIFSTPWLAGKPVKEVFPNFTVKEALEVFKRGKKMLNHIVKLSMECPKSDREYEYMIEAVVKYCKVVFKITNAVLFENPEMYTQLPPKMKEYFTSFNKDRRDFDDIIEKICYPSNGIINKLDKIDRFSGKLRTSEIRDFFERDELYEFNEYLEKTKTGSSWVKLTEHEELILVGWFKELRYRKLGIPWFEEYLKEISLPTFTSEDLRMILLYSEIIDRDIIEISGSDELIDIFWDNTDKIYEALFHENIYNTPTYIAKVYVSQYQLGEQKERH